MASLGQIAGILADFYETQKEILSKQVEMLRKLQNLDGLTESSGHVVSVRGGEKKKKTAVDPNKPKRSKSAYVLYMCEKFPILKAENPTTSPKEILVEIGREWSLMPAENKAVYHQRAAAEKMLLDPKNSPYVTGATAVIAHSDDEDDSDEEEEVERQPVSESDAEDDEEDDDESDEIPVQGKSAQQIVPPAVTTHKKPSSSVPQPKAAPVAPAAVPKPVAPKPIRSPGQSLSSSSNHVAAPVIPSPPLEPASIPVQAPKQSKQKPSKAVPGEPVASAAPTAAPTIAKPQVGSEQEVRSEEKKDKKRKKEKRDKDKAAGAEAAAATTLVTTEGTPHKKSKKEKKDKPPGVTSGL